MCMYKGQSVKRSLGTIPENNSKNKCCCKMSDKYREGYCNGVNGEFDTFSQEAKRNRLHPMIKIIMKNITRSWTDLIMSGLF